MALTLTAVETVNGPTCGHLRLTVDVDGTPRTLETTAAELAGVYEDAPGGYRGALLLAWLRYQRAQGRTLASLVGRTVVS